MHMSHTTGRPLPKAPPRISKSDFRKSVGSASESMSLTKGCGVSRTPDSFQSGRYTRSNAVPRRLSKPVEDYALLMQGYNSRRSVELPAVWPNARFVGKGLRNRRRALARGQAPPLRLEAEVFLRDSRGSRSGLRDAGPARIAPLEFAKYRLNPGWAPG